VALIKLWFGQDLEESDFDTSCVLLFLEENAFFTVPTNSHYMTLQRTMNFRFARTSQVYPRIHCSNEESITKSGLKENNLYYVYNYKLFCSLHIAGLPSVTNVCEAEDLKLLKKAATQAPSMTTEFTERTKLEMCTLLSTLTFHKCSSRQIAYVVIALM
jgi:hypothetical protein